MKKAVNKVRHKDGQLEDNTAALELVAESSEKLSNNVDRNTERMKQLEQRLADMGQPVHRYSKEKPEQVQSVQQAVPIVISKPQEQAAKPKFERKQDNATGFFSTISNAGKTFASSVLQAGADFGKSMTDQIGSELLPFYSDMKAAASKVAGGALEAGRVVKSRFERAAEDKKEKKTGIVPQAVIEKTEKTEKVTELKNKMRDRKQEHFQHKLYKKVDDIHDVLRNMMIMNLLKAVIPDFGSFGSAIGKFAGMFARGGLVFAFFAGLKAWGSKFIDTSLKQISSAFSSITSGIKDTFTKSVDAVKDGWKKLTEPRKVETATPKSKPDVKPDTKQDVKPDTKPKPVLDKDGKPVVDKTGKPVFEKSVAPVVENKVEKTVESTAMQSATKGVAVEAAETAGSKFAKKTAGRFAAGAMGGPFAEIIVALMTLKDGLELALAAFGKSPEDIGKWVDENTSMPEVNKAQTAAAGEKLTFTGATAEKERKEWEAMTEAERNRVRKHEENLTNVYKSIATAQGSSSSNNNTVINNNATYQAPMSFPSDRSSTAMGDAFERAFRSRSF